MLKRYFHTVWHLLLLCLLYCVVLLPLQLVRSNLDNRQYWFSLAIWAVFVAVTFFPALAVIIKKVWFFSGKGEPILGKLLESMLLDVNNSSGPVQAIKKRKKLVVTWKYNDPQWCELFRHQGMKKIREMSLHFDNSTKTVTISDRQRSIRFISCPNKVRIGLLAVPRLNFGVQLGKEWGVENYTNTGPEDYMFHPREMKSPVMGTILKNGWNVRFKLF